MTRSRLLSLALFGTALLACSDVPPIPTPNAARLAFIRAEQEAADASFDVAVSTGVASHATLGARLAFDEHGARIGGVRMGLVAMGRGAALSPVDAARSVAIQQNRVTLQREAVDAWWLNGPLGVEHGFVLATRPSGDGPLVLRVAVAGGVAGSDEAGGARIRAFGTGQIYRYTDLFAEDDRGRALEATMRVADHHVDLWIDDRGASYPVRVDPLVWTETVKLLADDGAPDDLFGSSMDISGDYLIVGAAHEHLGPDNGAAYIYERDGAGVWIQEPTLMASDGDASVLGNNAFGLSVAISGDYAIIGARNDGNPGSRGSAYVFERDAQGVWQEQPKLVGDSGVGAANFGYAVSLSGDTAIVGAHFDNSRGTNAGAAYFFERDAVAGWEQALKVTAPDAANEDNFGWTVAVRGDYAMVGSPGDFDTFTNQGSVHVFERVAGLWDYSQKLVASDPSGNSNFGNAVDIDGDRAIVGSWHDDDDGSDSGSAYVFERDATGTWNEVAKLTASDANTFDNFGVSVAISGNVAVVGAAFDGINRGGAYVFERDVSGAWNEEQKLTASDADNGDQFGSSVTVEGGRVFVGARGDEDDNGFLAGSVYAFDGVLAPGSDGAPCADANECDSGFCVDGVCCASACGDGDTTDCQACSAALGSSIDGNCEPVSATMVCRDAANACDAPESCDGTSLTCPADESAPDGTPCEAGTCSDGMCVPSGEGGGDAAGAGGNGNGGGGEGGAGGQPGSGGDANGDGDGCSCAVVGTRRAGGAALVFAFVVLGASLRRRRRRPVAGMRELSA